MQGAPSPGSGAWTLPPACRGSPFSQTTHTHSPGGQQWCERLNCSAWKRRKNSPGRPSSLNGTVCSETGGLGKLGLPSPSSFFVLLVCFFNLTSAAVCPPRSHQPHPQQSSLSRCVRLPRSSLYQPLRGLGWTLSLLSRQDCSTCRTLSVSFFSDCVQ